MFEAEEQTFEALSCAITQNRVSTVKRVTFEATYSSSSPKTFPVAGFTRWS